jgi:hypothetical protein
MRSKAAKFLLAMYKCNGNAAELAKARADLRKAIVDPYAFACKTCEDGHAMSVTYRDVELIKVSAESRGQELIDLLKAGEEPGLTGEVSAEIWCRILEAEVVDGDMT